MRSLAQARFPGLLVLPFQLLETTVVQTFQATLAQKLFDDTQTEIVAAPVEKENSVVSNDIRTQASIAEARKAIMKEAPALVESKKEITAPQMANLNPDNNPHLRADGLPHHYPRNWIFSEVQQQPSGKRIPIVR